LRRNDGIVVDWQQPVPQSTGVARKKFAPDRALPFGERLKLVPLLLPADRFF
jgi:hypothetical protein